MAIGAFQGLANVLLHGLDAAQQQRQRQLQEAMLLQQLIGQPPPPTVTVPTPFGEIPMTAEQMIKAGIVGPQEQETPTLPAAFFADLAEATRTGDWSQFRQQWGDVTFPTADAARIFQAPQYAATAGVRGVEADERRADMATRDAGITPEEAEYMGRPELAGMSYRQALLGTELAGAVAGVEEARSRTGLNLARALVEQGQLDLARDQFTWQQFVDEEAMSQRAKEFAHSVESEEWRRGFEERKQQFFEDLERLRLQGQQADRMFDQWLQRERLALERAAHQLQVTEALGGLGLREREIGVQEGRLALDRDRLAFEQREADRAQERWMAEDARTQERHAAEMETRLLENEMLRAQLQHLPEQLQAEVRSTIARAARDEAEAQAVSDTLSYVIQQMQAQTSLDIARAANLDAQTATEEELRRARYDVLVAEAEQALEAAGLSRARADEIMRLIEPTIAQLEAETALTQAQTATEEARGDLVRAQGAEAWQRVDDLGMEAVWQLLGLPGEPPPNMHIYRWQLDGLASTLRALKPSGGTTTVPFRELAALAGIDTSNWPQEIADAPIVVGDPRALAEAIESLATTFLTAPEGVGVTGAPQLPPGSGPAMELAYQYAQSMATDPAEVQRLADQALQRLMTAYNAYLRWDEQQHMLFGGIRDRNAPPVMDINEYAAHFFLGAPLPEAVPLNRLDGVQQAWLYDALEQFQHPTAFREYLERLNNRQRQQVLEQFGMPATGWEDLMDIVRWIEAQALAEGRVMP